MGSKRPVNRETGGRAGRYFLSDGLRHRHVASPFEAISLLPLDRAGFSGVVLILNDRAPFDDQDDANADLAMPLAGEEFSRRA